MNLQENTLFDLCGQGHAKCWTVPSTPCDLLPAKLEVAMSNIQKDHLWG